MNAVGVAVMADELPEERQVVSGGEDASLPSLRFDSICCRSTARDCSARRMRKTSASNDDHCCAQLVLPTLQMRQNVQEL